jgi:hypothetical protein
VQQQARDLMGAVGKHGDQAQALFMAAVQRVRQERQALEKKIEEAPADEKLLLEAQKNNALTYVKFDFPLAEAHLQARWDK